MAFLPDKFLWISRNLPSDLHILWLTFTHTKNCLIRPDRQIAVLGRKNQNNKSSHRTMQVANMQSPSDSAFLIPLCLCRQADKKVLRPPQSAIARQTRKMKVRFHLVLFIFLLL